jgi:hypothetical protein
MGDTTDYAKTIKEIMKRPENSVCADCDAKGRTDAFLSLHLLARCLALTPPLVLTAG